MMSIHNLVLLQEDLEKAKSKGMLYVQVSIEDCDNLIKAANDLIKVAQHRKAVSLNG